MHKSVAIIGTRGYPSYYGGFETAVRKLAPYLADRGWDVTVYGRPGSTCGGGDSRVGSVSTWGIESKSLSTLSYGLSSCLDVARRQPDVALIMNVANGYWLPILRARGIPTLVNVDGIEWQREKWSQLAKLVFKGGARQTARWADEIVVDAEAIAHYWREHYGRDGQFIPYGGDLPSAPSSRELPFSSGSYVLLVARFVPENTILEFLQAALRIAERHPVVLVGSSGYGGDLEDRIDDLSTKMENICWLGHVADDSFLHKLWANAGVYFHGHSVGGTNPALVQAMTSGAPIVARDTIYNREVLGSAGVFTGATPDEIYSAIIGVIESDDVRRRLSRSARERAESEYTWDKVNAAYLASLTQLADRTSELVTPR